MLNVLDILEGMSAHFHEHHDDILRWPWKLFCVKWSRLIRAAGKQRHEQEERERKAALDRFSAGVR